MYGAIPRPRDRGLVSANDVAFKILRKCEMTLRDGLI